MTITVIGERFPVNLRYGQISGPGFSTQVVSTAGGFTYSNQYWANPLRRFQVESGNTTLAQFASLNAFLLSVAKGRTNIFLLKHWDDFQATVAQFAIADGVATVYKLYKPYAYGGQTYSRRITQPNTDVTLQVFVNAVLTAVTVNYATGKVTFASPPAMSAVLTWTGNFDVPVRMDADYAGLTYEAFTQVNARGVTMTEARVE